MDTISTPKLKPRPMLTIIVKEVTRRKVKRRARLNRMSVSHWLRRVVEQALSEQESHGG